MTPGASRGSRHPVRDAIARLIRASAPVGSALNAVGSVGIFLLMGLICVDVVGRYGFNSPVAGVTEIVELSIVVIVFVQLTDTSAHGRLTRADTLVDALRVTRPRVAHAIDGVASLCGFALMAILAYGVVPAAVLDFQRGSYSGTVGIFTFPSWPVKAIVGVGSMLTAVQLLLISVHSFVSMAAAPSEAPLA